MNLVISNATNAKTMSSLEIAELTGKEHAHVMRDIRTMLEQAELGEAKFGDTYIHPQNGQKYPLFNLPRRECDLLMSGYSVKYRLAIIDRWQELESQQFKVPSNFKEALLLAVSQQEEIEMKDKIIQEQAPQIAALKRISASEGSLCLTDVAKELGVLPHKKLFVWLHANGWIYKRLGTDWIATVEYLKKDYLEQKTVEYISSDGTQKIKTQCRVTPKGLAKLAEIFTEELKKAA